jgi:hypothetical protein
VPTLGITQSKEQKNGKTFSRIHLARNGNGDSNVGFPHATKWVKMGNHVVSPVKVTSLFLLSCKDLYRTTTGKRLGIQRNVIQCRARRDTEPGKTSIGNNRGIAEQYDRTVARQWVTRRLLGYTNYWWRIIHSHFLWRLPSFRVLPSPLQIYHCILRWILLTVTIRFI